MTQSYPLSWPTGWKRTERNQIKVSKFHKLSGNNWDGSFRQRGNLTIANGVAMLMKQLRMLNAKSIVISSNLHLTTYGEPRSGQREPDDSGVAVYFELKDKPRVLACDKWSVCADNMAAIAKHIDALRAQDRWGVGSVDQAFAGYAALEAPKKWRDVLGCVSNVTLKYAEDQYRYLAKQYHPDMPNGSHEQFTAISNAIEQAREELK